MEYVQYKNGKPHYYRDAGPEIEECLQYQVSLNLDYVISVENKKKYKFLKLSQKFNDVIVNGVGGSLFWNNLICFFSLNFINS